MTAALIIIGLALLGVGWLFFWLNISSPIQTRIPLFTLPTGFVVTLLGLARLIS